MEGAAELELGVPTQRVASVQYGNGSPLGLAKPQLGPFCHHTNSINYAKSIKEDFED